jgi:hypothetical protein
LAKVYVSSTIADLTEERRAVLDWLRRARHQAVDSYLPDSDTVEKSCLEDVGICDLYVLIAGHRYGFQPPEDNPEGLSITHLEFRRAGECGIPRVALLRMNIPDVRLSDLEDPARAPLVRAFRDEVAREVRPAEFTNLEGLIQGLSTGVQGELDKLARLDQQPAGPVAVGRVLRLAPRPVFLAGREELLAELNALLTGDGGAGPRVVALCGPGGAGKTSVALEYAHRQLAEVGVGWQFAAENPTVLAAGFAELAAQLGVRDATDSRDPVASVHGMLAVFSAEWLLVFDNAPDRAVVEGFLPPAGRGRMLITTQNQDWPPGQALQVPVLDTEVAAGFLINRTADADQRAPGAARDLATELGGLPLALEQAGAYIQATGDSIAGYLASFRQRRADMLGRGEPTGYRKTVATAWALALDQLEQSAAGAVGLLRLLAYCAPEAVPLRLLLQPCPGLAEQLGDEVASALLPLQEDELAAKDAIAALRRYSLVSQPADGSVSVHRLIQAITADQMPAELAAAWRQAAAVVIESALPANPQNPESWSVFALLLPHAQAALSVDTGGMGRVASYVGFSGSYGAACDLQQEVLKARERVLGLDHPDTLAARAGLAYFTGMAGNTAGARDQFASLVPVHKRVLGPRHPDTLAARVNLAYFTGMAGNTAGARDQFASLVPVHKRVLGLEHPDTLAARAGLALWTGLAGDTAGARDQFAAVAAVHERVLGAEHPDTLATRANLAQWAWNAGDAAGARDQYAALLPVRERVLGAEHPDTLAARFNLADWTGEAGNAAGARDQFAALLPVRERVLGAEHPQTLAARANLAHWIGEAGNAAGARDQYAALLPVFERVLGPEHPDTLMVRGNQARWTGGAGDAAGARDLYAALLPVRERVLGPKHPMTLTARSNLAHYTREAARGGN